MILSAGEVVVDMVLRVCLGRIEEIELRMGVRKARMTARTAIIVAKAFVEKSGVDWCVVVVSVIRREGKSRPRS